MNKYEEKLLEQINGLIPKLQAFVDSNIVGDKAMPAAEIASRFISKEKCKISPDDLTKAFRLAIRENLIIGIEGAKRAGYRRCGVVAKTSSPDSVLEPFIEDLQALINRMFVGSSTRMTAEEIYKAFLKENTCGVAKDAFIIGIRAAIRGGKLTGLENAGPAGYKKGSWKPRKAVSEDESSDATVTEDEDDESIKCEIVIDDTRRIIATDNRNWNYQVRGGATWTTAAYFSNTTEMVRAIARKMIEGNIKSLNSFNFKELVQKIQEAEARLGEKIQQLMTDRDWNRICAKLHIPASSKSDEVLAAIESLIDAANVSAKTVIES